MTITYAEAEKLIEEGKADPFINQFSHFATMSNTSILERNLLPGVIPGHWPPYVAAVALTELLDTTDGRRLLGIRATNQRTLYHAAACPLRSPRLEIARKYDAGEMTRAAALEALEKNLGRLPDDKTLSGLLDDLVVEVKKVRRIFDDHLTATGWDVSPADAEALAAKIIFGTAPETGPPARGPRPYDEAQRLIKAGKAAPYLDEFVNDALLANVATLAGQIRDNNLQDACFVAAIILQQLRNTRDGRRILGTSAPNKKPEYNVENYPLTSPRLEIARRLGIGELTRPEALAALKKELAQAGVYPDRKTLAQLLRDLEAKAAEVRAALEGLLRAAGGDGSPQSMLEAAHKFCMGDNQQ